MNRARFLVLSFVLLGIALVACRAFDDVPGRGQICQGGDMTTPLMPDLGACTQCIEDTACCDQVGRCAADTSCPGEVRETFECVLGQGTTRAAENEPRCTGGSTDLARGVYECARANCGSQCALPVCKLDPTVPFIANTECDRCFSLSCCNEFNACEQNRFCKFALDCIVNTCQAELETTLSRTVVEASRAIERFACNPEIEAGLPPGQTDPNGASTCTNACLDTYIRTGEVSADVKEAACLALRVQRCGAEADCGPKCRVAADAGDRDAQ